jgi:hypothetical protein
LSGIAAGRKAFFSPPLCKICRSEGTQFPISLFWDSRSIEAREQKRIKPMRKMLLSLAALGGLLLLGACDHSSSSLFDGNCSGNGGIVNPAYCTGTLHPNAGPYASGMTHSE